MIALTFIVMLLSIPFVLFAFQKSNLLLLENQKKSLPNAAKSVQDNTNDKTAFDWSKQQHEHQGRYAGYSSASKREESSNIIARIGYKSLQEPLGARSLLMQNILPKQKRSKYMIPIAEPKRVN